jgi:hypothetical protein
MSIAYRQGACYLAGFVHIRQHGCVTGIHRAVIVAHHNRHRVGSTSQDTESNKGRIVVCTKQRSGRRDLGAAEFPGEVLHAHVVARQPVHAVNQIPRADKPACRSKPSCSNKSQRLCPQQCLRDSVSFRGQSLKRQCDCQSTCGFRMLTLFVHESCDGGGMLRDEDRTRAILFPINKKTKTV